MAYHERLNQWLLKNAKSLNLRVTKLDWIHQHFNGYSDIAVKIEIALSIFEGRGTDTDADIALVKAVTEAIERFVCRENKISSVGVAGHYDLNLAKKNALFEFIERTAINFHFSQKIGMNLISTNQISVNIKALGFVQLNVHQFQMNVPNGFTGVFTLAEGLDSVDIGGIMGSAVCKDLDVAIKKSSIECFRNVFALSIANHDSTSIDDLRKIKSPTSLDSQNLLFDKSYCKHLLELFLSENKTASELDPKSLVFEELRCKSEVLQGFPLKFVRCLDQNRNPAPDTEFVG